MESGEFNFEFVRTLAIGANHVTEHVGVKILGVRKTLLRMCSG